MKTIVISCTFAIMLLASAASAGPLTWAQVGSVDTLVALGTASNSGKGEKDWIAQALGIQVANLSYKKITDSSGDNWQSVGDTNNIFALDVGAEPSLVHDQDRCRRSECGGRRSPQLPL